MMLKKKLLLLAMTALTVLFAAACGKAKVHAAVSQTKGAIFTVGFDADFPPYGFKAPSGEYTGFDLELAREVCKRNGWIFEAKPIAWDAKDMELNSGAIDCIWNGFTINGREDSYEWSSPYVDNSQVILVMKDSPINDLKDLAGKTVAAQTDTPVLKALSANGEKEALGKTFKKLVVTPNYNNAIMELESGSVDAIALDIGVAKTKMPFRKYRMLDEAVLSEKYGIGFKKGNKAIRDVVEKTLIEIVKDGTASNISAKYFDGQDVLIIGKISAAEVKAEIKAAAADSKSQISAELDNLKAAAKEVKDATKNMVTTPASAKKADAKAPVAK